MEQSIKFKVVDGEIDPEVKSVQIYRPIHTKKQEKLLGIC